MDHKHTLTELNNCSREELITMVLSMQGQLDMLNQNIEKLIEQVRLANSYRFGKHTETLKSIDGQLSFFDEAEAAYGWIQTKLLRLIFISTGEMWQMPMSSNVSVCSLSCR